MKPNGLCTFIAVLSRHTEKERTCRLRYIPSIIKEDPQLSTPYTLDLYWGPGTRLFKRGKVLVP